MSSHFGVHLLVLPDKSTLIVIGFESNTDTSFDQGVLNHQDLIFPSFVISPPQSSLMKAKSSCGQRKAGDWQKDNWEEIQEMRIKMGRKGYWQLNRQVQLFFGCFSNLTSVNAMLHLNSWSSTPPMTYFSTKVAWPKLYFLPYNHPHFFKRFVKLWTQLALCFSTDVTWTYESESGWSKALKACD